MRKFNNEILWRVTVDVNGKQEYNINAYMALLD